MKTHIYSWSLLFAAALVWAGCDFQAAQDAFDDFNLVIELEPINTVVNGTIVDNSGGDLVSAVLTFSGEDSAVLIDAYSDPVDAMNAESGVVTFGVQNSVVPTESNPVTFTVTATADGYFTTSRTVNVTDVGDASFSLQMTRDNPTATVQGTSSTQSTAVQTSSTGAVSQTTTVQTQSVPQTQSTASASLTVQQGTTPLTRNGTPLQGQITTQLRAYDSGSGMTALPSGALGGDDGTNQSIVGATFFKMSDGAGNVAVDFQSATGKRGALGKSASACEDANGTAIRVSTSNPDLLAAFSLFTNPTATVFAYTPADNANNEVAAGVPITLDGGELVAELCFGGTAPNVNLSALGDPSAGIFYTFSLVPGGGVVLDAGTLDHRVTVVNPASAAMQAQFTLVGPGLLVQTSRQLSAGSTTLSLASLLDDGNDFAVLVGASYILTATLPSGDVVATSVSPSPRSGTSTMSLPASAALQSYNVVASLQCANPASQKFDVQVTSQSLDAVSAFYRVNVGGSAWALIRKSDITSKEATDSSIRISGNISLLPNTAYRFKGVLGDNSADEVATTPGSGGTFNINLDPSKVGLTCTSR